MFDVHTPHNTVQSWKDFFIHIAIITIGLLIAVGIEQTVEAVHHLHQRHQLEYDLHEEAISNREIILHDLKLEDQEKWFTAVQAIVDREVQHDGKLSFTTSVAPCAPGTINGPSVVYHPPSESVWSTAKESNLVYLLPVEQARIYSRLAYTFELLRLSRDNLAMACERVYAIQTRFAKRSPDGTEESWSMSPDQAERLADAAAATDAATRGVILRLKYCLAYVEGFLRGDRNIDTWARSVFEPSGNELKREP
jgi:hypothetical protein